MKIKFGTDKIFYLLILSYVVYIAVLIINRQPNPFVAFGLPETAIYQNTLKPIDENIPDTIPFNEYQKRKDSINTIRDAKNGDGYFEGSAANFPGWASTWCSLSCDTCSLRWINKTLGEGITNKQYYIILNGWTLKLKNRVFTQRDTAFSHFWEGPDSVEFYVKGKQAYVRKVIKMNPDSKINSDYYLIDIPVKFRFHNSDKKLMIPVSKTVKQTLDIIFVAFDIFLAVYIITLFIRFFEFVWDLSKGKAFTDKNVNRLKTISLSLMLYPILLFLLNLLTRLIFNGYFTADVVLSDVYIVLWKTILVGFVFYVLYRAFKAGKALQDEHDLTV